MKPAPPTQAQFSGNLNRATAYINSAALQHNASIAQSIAPDAKLLAVIKANAYGHGMPEVAEALAPFSHGFAVARIDEAVLLRQHQQQAMIVVMSPVLNADTLSLCIEHRLTPVIHSQQAVDFKQLTALNNYWLKMDIGMHRLGMTDNEITDILNQANIQPTLMTHFSSAERINPSTMDAQLNEFKKVLNNQPKIAISLANSAALLRHNDAPSYNKWQNEQLGNDQIACEYIRPGIMLYGADPLENPNITSQSLLPVMTLAAPILSTRRLKMGGTVGYNGHWQAKRDSVIATIGIGYGDGYPRHAPNGTPVLIHKQQMPLAGKVSMDTISVDITELTNQGINVKAGDTAQLWGQDLPANHIAALSETIAYELFTGISERVSRIFI